MKRSRQRLPLLFTLVAFLATRLPAADSSPLDEELQGLVEEDGITVVHTWAPWCANCHVEMRDDQWADFIEANPDVTFAFVEIWNDGENSSTVLHRYGLGEQANLRTLVDPNPRRGDEKTTHLLGQKLTWVPSTWVYQRGRIRYAVLYGEVRFNMLQQMIDDTRRSW